MDTRTQLLRLARITILSLACVLCFAHVDAQTGKQVEVTGNANLRPSPSTAETRIVLLRPPVRLDLLEPTPTNGYFHVRAQGGTEGWVWSRRVREIQSANESAKLTGVETAAPSTAPAPAPSVSRDWPKGTPRNTTFHGQEGDCAFNGNGSDPTQFALKNRADTPASYHDVTWSAVDQLDFPGRSNHHFAPTHRTGWSQAQLAVIQPFEGIPVRVVGFIVAVKPQTGNSEGTNCNFSRAGDVDTHIALAENSGGSESESIVIEWTPRFLTAHPNWTKAKLSNWLNSDKPVRISGWLMLDPDHVAHLGRFRNTLWEIHPITRIEVFKDGAFVDLDTLP